MEDRKGPHRPKEVFVMRQVKPYTTIVRTEDGGSAFREDELGLDEQQVASGIPPMLVGRMSSSAPGVMFVLSNTSIASDPHPAPRRQWVVVLRGMIDVEVSDGTRKRFGAGDLIFVTDTTGRGHISVTVGEPPFEALFIPSE
jgi:hypothetical protein